MVSDLRTHLLQGFNYLLRCYLLTDSEFSCLAMMAKPYSVCGQAHLPLIPNQLHYMSNCAHEVHGTICGATRMLVFTIKAFVLFIHDQSFVLAPAFFIAQPLFVIHFLIWKDFIVVSFRSGAWIALLSFVVDFIFHWGRASRFSLSQTRNKHKIG